jgi:hypothetical protein
MPSTDRKLELKAKTSVAQTVSQPCVYAKGLTDQNTIQEEIKSRLKLGNACYYSVQTDLSSRLLSRNLKDQDI